MPSNSVIDQGTFMAGRGVTGMAAGIAVAAVADIVRTVVVIAAVVYRNRGKRHEIRKIRKGKKARNAEGTKCEKGMNAEGMKCEKGYEMGKVKRVCRGKRYE